MNLKENSDNTTEVKEEKKTSFKEEVFSTLRYLVAVVLITLFIINFVGVRVQVIGTSMSPTLSDKDNLIVEKLSYRFSDPKRFDIIVFPYQQTNKHYIKRIIGLPGETVQIIDGYVYINGELLNEDYGNAVMESAGIAINPIVLGKDEYFVLGDNRNNSEDSRFGAVGNIHKKDIDGRAWLRIWPFDQFGILEHQ